MYKFIVGLISFIALSISARPLLLVSIDGFTPEYFELYQPPFLTKLINSGAYSGQMQPVFPSKTFPNHLSIVTGVYPQKHGIIHNSFYHPIINKEYKLGLGKTDSRWLTAKPLWIMAEQQGIKSATYFWPESEARFDDILPTFMEPYDGKIPNDQRLDTVVDWLSLPEDKKPQFITTYFSTVDSAGHEFGIHSTQAKEAVLSVDASLARFYQKLEQNGLTDLDIIIVSDHGMAEISKAQAITIESLGLSEQLDQVVNGQTQLYIYEKDQSLVKQTMQQLNKVAKGRFQVFEKGSYPAHWHLNTDMVAIPDLIVTTEPPFSFTKDPNKVIHSTHGFDPKSVSAMNAIFIAHGPSFKKHSVAKFNNVDIMPLMLKLLDMPAPDYLDGNIDNLSPILKQ